MNTSTILLTLTLLSIQVGDARADYRLEILKDQPAAYWSFDKAVGLPIRNEISSVSDGRDMSTTKRRHGVSQLAASFDRQQKSGRVEVRLDQQQDQAIEQLFNGSFSLELWLLDEASAPDGKTNHSILYKADRKTFTRNSLWLYRDRKKGHYNFRIHGRDGNQLGITLQNPAGEKKAGDQKWHHLVITADRSEIESGQGRLRAFLDGKQVGESTFDSIAVIDNDGSLIIGNNHTSNSPWQGGIDELALYGRVLDAATISRHHEIGRRELKTKPSESSLLVEQREFFELKIRPLLIEKCVDCHDGDPDSDSILAVGSRQALLKGGDFGPTILPGRATDSLLIHTVKRIHKELQMPPASEDALSPEEISDLARWINEGAVWGETDFTNGNSQGENNSHAVVGELSSTHWSFQPRHVVDPPKVSETRWMNSEIDRFIEAKRQEKKLTAVQSATRRTLIRRATLDLIGLPPTLDEITAYLKDPSEDDVAFERVINRLLASTQYGERQGRLWLDVARYADTQGDVGDIPIPEAYRYRNWVIDSLNDDLPFDQFLQAQIAGDILARDAKDEATARSLVVATGFIALSRRFGNSKADDMHLTIEDTLDTLGRGVLGLTFRCARCHDHKFDPILSSDYYGLYGIFESTVYPWMGMSNEKSPSALSPAIPSEESLLNAKKYWALISRYEYQINNHFRPWLKPTLDEFKEVSKQIEIASAAKQPTSVLEEKREELLSRYKGKFRELMLHDLAWIKGEKKKMAENSEIEFVFAVSEGAPHDAKRHRRGNPRSLGEVAPRRFLQIIDGAEPPKINSGSGRLELAQWLTQPDHPLTARVIVNRIWQQHFGRGLVATPDNFGLQGVEPTHPQLLDWLSEQFVNDGWSLKKLHRRIMLSQSYRLSSGPVHRETEIASNDQESIDPENLYLWRFSRRRLEAEVIRDSMLAVTGLLDTSQGGPHPFKPWHSARFSLNRPFHEEFPTNRRSVYLMTQRLFRNSFLGLFDGPDRNSSSSTRNSSNVPSQALYLMNSDFIKKQSEAFSQRLLDDESGDEERVSHLFQLAYGRDPDSVELKSLLDFLIRYRTEAGNSEKDAQQNERQALTAMCRVVLTSNEFFFID